MRLTQIRFKIDGVDESTDGLFVKFGLGSRIYKFYRSRWLGNGRWQVDEPVELPLSQSCKALQFEVLVNTEPYPSVLGDGQLPIKLLEKGLLMSDEIKSPLKINEESVGWFYICYQMLSMKHYQHYIPSHIIYLKQVNLKLNKNFALATNLKVKKENSVIFKGAIGQISTKKNFELDLAVQVRLSDVLTFSIEPQNQECFDFSSSFFTGKKVGPVEAPYVSLILDNITRKKFVSESFWLCSRHLKIGQLTVWFILESVFIPRNTVLFVNQEKFVKVKQSTHQRKIDDENYQTFKKKNNIKDETQKSQQSTFEQSIPETEISESSACEFTIPQKTHLSLPVQKSYKNLNCRQKKSSFDCTNLSNKEKIQEENHKRMFYFENVYQLSDAQMKFKQ